jgi:hypothetical protein
MSATITWRVQSLLCKKQEDNLQDVVYQVAYSCVANQTQDGTDYVESVNSGVDIALVPDGSFIPFDQLTEAEVLQWVWSNGVEKDKVEAGLQSMIDKKINSNDVVPPLPWVPSGPLAEPDISQPSA